MGNKLEDLEFKAKLYVPGPGTHNPSPLKDVPQTKFGSDVRKTFNDTKKSPGPGAYLQDSSRSIKKSAPSYGFGSSTRDGSNRRMNVPGPGNYSSTSHRGREQPSYSMGLVSRYSPEKREASYKPGPGNYSPGVGQVKKAEPAVKIGTELRRDLKAEKA